MPERAIIDTKTGEVISCLKEGDKILRKQSIEHLKEIERSDFKNRQFVKVDYLEGLLLTEELDQWEKSMLYTLQYFVSYDSGIIKHINGHELGFDDIVGLTGFSREKASETISKLIDKDILYKGKNSRKVQYFMNPFVASRGVIVNPTLKEMFKNYRIRSKGGIMWKDLKE